jgi:cobalt transport family protein
MLRDVAFGQFYPTQSFVHRMDPRAKILLLILYITAIFCAVTYFSFALVAATLLVTILVSGVPFRSVIRSVKPILFIIIFTAVINLLFPREGNILFEFWIIRITDTALSFTIMMVLRLLLLVMGTSLLTFTTTPVALTDGIESLLKPLKVIRFPVHELALIMSIALRFIPTLMDETDRIIRAQKARGADFESGNLFKRAKAMLPILIPLLISAFRRADELSDAMESRCYAGAKGRTKFKKLTFGWRDLLAALVYVGITAAIIVDKILIFFPVLVV